MLKPSQKNPPPVSPDRLCQLKITLQHSNPPIWRRIVTRRDTPMDILHYIIQFAMGWENCHLHEFTVGSRKNLIRIGPGRDSFFPGGDPDVIDESTCTLDELLATKARKFLYIYDFGDDWFHEIAVEKSPPPDPAFKHPVCLEGENACPPEDSGGLWGYYSMLETAADPNHPEHEHIVEWLGEDFDATKFDLKKANRSLKRIRW
jgi:hypothetical protein